MNNVRVAVVLLILLVAGCGGGGSGGANLSISAGSQPAVAPPVIAQPTAPIAPPAPLPIPVAKLIASLEGASTAKAVVRIAGFGSSVSAGATLVAASSESPSAYLARQISARYPAAKADVAFENRSKNGSILSQFISDAPQGNWSEYLATGARPTLIVFAYGMNDGMPAMYNAAQPPQFFYSQMVAAIKLAQSTGAEPIVMTTPHPRSTIEWSMPQGIDQTFPSLVTAPVAAEKMTPSASDSILMQDPLSLGKLIPVSQRHLEINKMMRKAAADTGAALIDVEKLWFRAVADAGEDALFDKGETVHPNLLGHQLSYQRAVDAFVATLPTPAN